MSEEMIEFRQDSVCCAPRMEAVLQPAKGEITLLLAKWKDGEPSAFEELMPLVYSHLREVAASYIRRERNPDLLQATVLVHELYLRLLNQKKAAWEDRRHFYTFAAKVMRMILIDHAHHFGGKGVEMTARTQAAFFWFSKRRYSSCTSTSPAKDPDARSPH